MTFDDIQELSVRKYPVDTADKPIVGLRTRLKRIRRVKPVDIKDVRDLLKANHKVSANILFTPHSTRTDVYWLMEVE